LFGYVQIFKPELKLREYETYRAVYCSLCKEMGKSFGSLSRLTLSYDFAFLSLLRMAQTDECPGFTKKRCMLKPFTKRCFCADNGEIRFCAAVAVLMLSYKLQDNVDDSRGIKKLFCRIIKAIFSHSGKKAAKALPEIDQYMRAYFSAQSKLENGQCDSIDKAAEPTAIFLGKLFSFGDYTQVQKRVLDRLGYCIGKWIYLTDALDDLPKDKKSGSYNALGAYDEREIRERITPLLHNCVTEAGAAFELLEIKRFGGILENVIYQGMPQVQSKIAGGVARIVPLS